MAKTSNVLLLPPGQTALLTAHKALRYAQGEAAAKAIMAALKHDGYALFLIDRGRHGKTHVLASSLDDGSKAIALVSQVAAEETTVTNKADIRVDENGIVTLPLGNSRRVLYAVPGEGVEQIAALQARIILHQTQQILALQRELKETKDLSIRDPLTGLKNRGAFLERLQTLVSDLHRETFPATESQRGPTDKDSSQTPLLALVMFDIDHFKSFNDRYGHAVGDKALCLAAKIAQSTLRRPVDDVFRIGGEEFMTAFVTTNREGAATVAEKLRAEIEKAVFYDGNDSLRMTISVGAIMYDPTTDGDISQAQLMELVDGAMYQAKQTGRNRVVTLAPSSKNIAQAVKIAQRKAKGKTRCTEDAKSKKAPRPQHGNITTPNSHPAQG